MDKHSTSDRGAKFSNVFLSHTEHPLEWAELGEDEVENVIQQVLNDFEGEGASLEDVLRKVDSTEREFAYDSDKYEPFTEPTTVDDAFDIEAQFPGVVPPIRVPKVPAKAPVAFASIDKVISEENKAYEKRQRAKEAQKQAEAVAEQVAWRYEKIFSKMKERLEFLEAVLQDGKKARHRWAKEKMALDEKIEDLTMANVNLEDRIADLQEATTAGQAGGGFFVSGAKPINRSAGGDRFDFDVDQLDDTEVRLEKVEQRSFVAELTRLVGRHIARMVPFTKDIRFISRHYGTTFGDFFGFSRFLFFLACGILLVYAPLTLPQLGGDYVSKDSAISDVGLCGFAPCAFLFGGFYRETVTQTRDDSLALRYIFVSAFSAIVTLYLSLQKWAAFDKNFQAEVLEERMRKRKYAKVVFLCWDFRARTAADKDSFGTSLRNQLNALNEEAQLRLERCRMTKRDWYCLYARRAGGLLLNTLLIAVAWVAIGSASIYKLEVSQATQKILGEGGAGQKIGELAPNLVVIVVGGALPTVTKSITALEKWTPSARQRHTLGRLYMGKILNMLIFAALNFELMTGKALFASKPVMARDSTSFKCVENQAAASIFSLVMTEFAGGQLGAPIGRFVTAHVKHRILRAKGPVVLPPFEIPENVVNITYFQGLLWISMIMAPFTSLVAPFLSLFTFKWLQFVLVRLSDATAASESSDIGVLILRLFCATCAIFCVYSYLFLTYPFPHEMGCGPFKSTSREMVPYETAASSYVKSMSTENVFVNFVKEAIQTPAYYVVLAIIFFARGLFCKNKVRVLNVALERARVNSALQLDAAEREKRRLQRQNDMLKERLEKSKRQSIKT